MFSLFSIISDTLEAVWKRDLTEGFGPGTGGVDGSAIEVSEPYVEGWTGEINVQVPLPRPGRTTADILAKAGWLASQNRPVHVSAWHVLVVSQTRLKLTPREWE